MLKQFGAEEHRHWRTLKAHHWVAMGVLQGIKQEKTMRELQAYLLSRTPKDVGRYYPKLEEKVDGVREWKRWTTPENVKKRVQDLCEALNEREKSLRLGSGLSMAWERMEYRWASLPFYT